MSDLIEKYLDALQCGNLDSDLITLYGGDDLAFQKERYLRLLKGVKDRNWSMPVSIITAPGRTELGGNHTDHNHGRVLAASVHLDCAAVASANEGMHVEIHSSGFPDIIHVNLSNLLPCEGERGRPESLVRGVAAGLVQKGHSIGGLLASVHSNVIPGSGLSSSAAFAVLLGGIFNHLFNDDSISLLDLAEIAKKAENEFFGKPCGFMDQLASALGGVLHIDFKNPMSPRAEQIDCDFSGAGYHLVVVDTGGSHATLTPEYAAITMEMQAVAHQLGKQYLRGVSVADLMRIVPRLRKNVGDRAILRAIHFVQENRRVVDMVKALRLNWVGEYLKLVNDSGVSSWHLLQNCSPAGTPEMQGIPLALALSELFLDGNGACRVHGGGFEGTIQAYVPEARAHDYRRCIEEVFGEGSVIPLRVRSRGVVVLKPDGLIKL